MADNRLRRCCLWRLSHYSETDDIVPADTDIALRRRGR